jgi:hypothetical protein
MNFALRKCISCPSSCESCTDSLTCMTCAADFFLKDTKCVALADLDIGFYPDGANRI